MIALIISIVKKSSGSADVKKIIDAQNKVWQSQVDSLAKDRQKLTDYDAGLRQQISDLQIAKNKTDQAISDQQSQINSLKTKYAKIPNYGNLSDDSLTRVFSDTFK